MGYYRRFVGGYVAVDNDGLCVYCGERANALDHFVPVSVAYSLQDIFSFAGKALLPACHECNSIASNLVFKTVAAKRKYIHERLIDRYWSIYSLPDWTNEEIEELGRGLQGFVRSSQNLNVWLAKRLKWRNKDNPAYAKIVGIHFIPKESGKFTVNQIAGRSTITRNIETPLKDIE